MGGREGGREERLVDAYSLPFLPAKGGKNKVGREKVRGIKGRWWEL